MSEPERAPAPASPLEAALARSRALVEAARLVSAEGHDLDAVLDALNGEARRLFAADAVSLQLVTPEGVFVVRRPNPLLTPGTPFGVAGVPFTPGGPTRAAVETRRPVVSADFQQDERVPVADRALLRCVATRVLVPLFAGDALQGILHLDWTAMRAITPEDLEVAEALGAHAAVAIRTARPRARPGGRRRRVVGLMPLTVRGTMSTNVASWKTDQASG